MTLLFPWLSRMLQMTYRLNSALPCEYYHCTTYIPHPLHQEHTVVFEGLPRCRNKQVACHKLFCSELENRLLFLLYLSLNVQVTYTLPYNWHTSKVHLSNVA